MKYVIEEENTLFSYLASKLGNKEAKSIFKKYSVILNGKYVDKSSLRVDREDVLLLYKKIEDNIFIIYEDKDIIVVTKPYDLLTVSDLKRNQNTLYFKVSNYLKRGNKNNRVFVVHRLDYETSGLVIFAKSERVKDILQNNWNTLMKKRGYQAIVHGHLKDGKLIFNLKENRAQKVYVSKKDSYTKEAITEYKVIKSNNNYSLVDIEIKTGRKHQIRVSFKEIDCPIVGDKKYGVKDGIKQLCLIANELNFIHPVNKRKISLLIPIPENFSKLVDC